MFITQGYQKQFVYIGVYTRQYWSLRKYDKFKPCLVLKAISANICIKRPRLISPYRHIRETQPVKQVVNLFGYFTSIEGN